MVIERRKSRLLPSIQVELIKQFVAGATARTSAELVGVNRHTATLYFHKLREMIAEQMAAEAPFLAGEIEVDESYFGGVRKGKRGRGAAGKVPVFGLLKRGGRVYTVMIEDAKSQTLLGIIRDRIQPDSIVYTDSFRSYDVLDVSELGLSGILCSRRFGCYTILNRSPNKIANWDFASVHSPASKASRAASPASASFA